MSLYLIEATVLDDPAEFEIRILVDAPTKRAARRLAKAAAIETYNLQAGGWSSNPKVSDIDVSTFTIKPGVLMAFALSVR